MLTSLLRRCLLPALGCWLAGSAARAQAPANDDPCGAISLTLRGSTCTATTGGSNANATTTVVAGHQNPAPGCGAGGTLPRDVWYSIYTASTSPSSYGATITVTGSAAGQLRLYAAPSGCTGPFTLLACSAASASGNAAPPLVTGALQPATLYYICVNGYADADPTGGFTICATDGPAAPTCGSPVFTGLDPATATSATVSFANGANSSGPYQAVLTGGGTTQTVSASSSPLQFTGLTAATTYQLVLTGQCASGGSTPGAALSFTTPTAYCNAGLGGLCSSGNNITAVRILTTSLNNASQIPTCGTGPLAGAGSVSRPYTFFPPSRPTNTAVLLAGTTYQLSVSAEAGSSVSAWLDANQNGVFEVGEWTPMVLVPQSSTPVVLSLVVPATAVAGPTGLRLRSRVYGNPYDGTAACATFYSGETEDYTVTIARPTATRAATAAWPAPAYPNPATTRLTVPLPTLTGPAHLTLRDVLGRAVRAQAVAAGTSAASLSVGGLAQGTYLLTLEQAGQAPAVQRLTVAGP